MKKLLATSVIGTTILLADNFTLSSNDIKGQLTSKQFFNGNGCKGDNLSPQLSWSGVPKGTKSFGITFYDPDAPTGSGWWHWLAFDIPKDVTSIEEGFGNKPQKGVIQSLNDYGNKGFDGACTPKGHLDGYIFTVYALDVEKLGLDEDATPATVGYELNVHTIKKASLITYCRGK